MFVGDDEVRKRTVLSGMCASSTIRPCNDARCPVYAAAGSMPSWTSAYTLATTTSNQTLAPNAATAGEFAKETLPGRLGRVKARLTSLRSRLSGATSLWSMGEEAAESALMMAVEVVKMRSGPMTKLVEQTSSEWG